MTNPPKDEVLRDGDAVVVLHPFNRLDALSWLASEVVAQEQADSESAERFAAAQVGLNPKP